KQRGQLERPDRSHPPMPRYQPLARRNPSKKSRESKSKWTKEETTGETDALSRGRSMTQVRRIGKVVAPRRRDLRFLANASPVRTETFFISAAFLLVRNCYEDLPASPCGCFRLRRVLCQRFIRVRNNRSVFRFRRPRLQMKEKKQRLS